MRTKKRALALLLALILTLGLVPASALAAGETYAVTVTGAPEGASIVVVDSEGAVVGTGDSLMLPDGDYTCYAGADGCRAEAVPFAVSGDAVTVPVTLSAYAASGWTTTETHNMTVLTDAGVVSGVPKTAGEARVAWTSAVGGGWTNATTNALFVNGSLYVVGGGALKKINAETGAVEDTYTLASGNAYNYFITTAEGLIFVQEGLRVEAVDPAAMTQEWRSDALSAGNQNVTPLTYAGGYLYGGTVSTTGGGAVLFCLSAADGGIVWETQADLTGAGPSGYTGFYWAGPAVAGDYVACGSEGGRVYAANRFTGTIVDDFDIDVGEDGSHPNSIRSSVAVDGNYLYFTDKAGSVHKLGFNAGTGAFDDGSHLTAQITSGAVESVSTPVVYNGRLYVGSSGASGAGIGVFDVSGTGLTKCYEIPFAGTKFHDVSLVADGTTVYGYTTYYAEPGSILGFADTPGQTEPEKVDFGPMMGDASNYCAAMPALGPDGTLYFANDSGNLVALEKNTAYLTDLSCSIGDLDSAFAAWDEDYALIVPAGTASVTLGFALPADASATLNGTPDGGAGTAVALTDGSAAATIVVTKGADTRTYTVAVRAVGADASIKVVVNGSNSITGGSPAVLSPYGGSGNRYVVSGVTGSANNRVWVALSDPNAEIDAFTVTGGYSVASPTNSNVYDSVAYTRRVYFESLDGSAVVAMHVTAEDGETEATYYIFATTGSGIGAFAYADSVVLGHSALHFAAVGESETLTADCTYFGTSETKETLVWTSSDEDVATVGQNGVVTAVGEGTATVTVSGACASASCEVKVGARVYVTIADAGALVTGSDAAQTLLAQAPVTAEDQNGNGYIDIDDALCAAHEAYYPGGAAAGYSTYESVYGLGIAALWGVSMPACGYWVNDASAWSLADAVEPGDYITAFNYTDTTDWTDVYTAFSAPTASAKAGAAVTLTLRGYVYDTEVWQYVSSPCAGAAVTVPGTALTGTTGANGQVTLTFPSAGTYYIVASKADGSIVPAVCRVTVRNAASGGGTIRVSFALLGDDAHGTGGTKHTLAAGNLTTWIAKTGVTVPEGATVGDVFQKVLDARGYSYAGLSGGYISSVTTPGGITLAEFSNGDLSGWMYAVNGTHPQCGLNDYALEGGDEIIWHYTDDYTAEEGSGQWDLVHGGTAKEEEDGAETVTVTPSVSGGTARASVGEDELAAAAAAAKASGAARVTIAVETDEEISAARVSVDAHALRKVAGQTDAAVAVKTPVGSVELSSGALASLLEQAGDGDIVITVARKTGAEIAALLEAADGLTAADVAGAAVVQVSVASGGADITAFGGSQIALSIPVGEEYEEGARYKVVVVSAGGAVEILTGRVVRENGVLVAKVEVGHLSAFFVTREEIADFSDVPESAWYYDAAGFARANALMEGGGDNRFVPEAGMTRAMLVSVLHRLAGKPEPAAGTAFADVADGAWYADAAAWAGESGIVHGYGDGRFGPEDAVSREQMALMLRRFASYRGEDVSAAAELGVYADAGIVAVWALPAMRWAAAEKLITGTDTGALRPEAAATRAEAVVILMRFCKGVGK